MEKNSRLRILYVTSEESCPDARVISDCLSPFSYRVEPILLLDALRLEVDLTKYALILLSGGHTPEQRFSDFISSYPQRDVPLLIMVKSGAEASVPHCLSQGADQYLMVDDEGGYLHLLPTVVHDLLNRFRLEREKHGMLSALQYRNRALASLNQIGNELNLTLDFQLIMNQLMRSGIEILEAEGSSLWLWDDESENALVCRAVIHRAATPPLVGVTLENGGGGAGWAAVHNRSLILNSPKLDNRFAKEIDFRINFKTKTLMAIPLRHHNQVYGVLEFVNKVKGEFSNDDLQLAETLAAYAVTALENARLVDSLRQSTLELQERNAELNAFGHTVAHDVQNMISRVAGFSQYLLDEVERSEGPIAPEQIQHPAKIIVRDSTKMSKVIDALLLLSAVRGAEVAFEVVDVAAIFKETVERVAEQIEERGGEITFCPSWPLAIGYGPWIEEVWFNYLSNGLKYGGSPPVLKAGADLLETGMIRFWIADNGPGIAEEQTTRIFRPFTDYSHRKEAGYGLGLSIVQRIVTKMNGSVGVESRLGEGSCFYFTLPQAARLAK